jgi:hypothetical protein
MIGEMEAEKGSFTCTRRGVYAAAELRAVV